MSYEQNWGFTDPTDEFGVKVVFNDYGSEAPTKQDNEFIVRIGICSEIIGNSECLQEKFNVFRIVSDSEPISSVMVSRCLMQNLAGSLSALSSLRINEINVFTATGLNKKSSEDILRAIKILEEKFGVEILHVGRTLNDETKDANLEDVQPYEYHYNAVMECLFGAINHHILATEEWFTFHVDGQSNGVFAKISLDGATFLDVVAIKGFTVNTEDGSILLKFQTSCCRVTRPIMSELHDNKQSREDNAIPNKMVSMAILSTGEEVLVSASDSYRGILRDDTNPSQTKQTNKIKSDPVLLTKLDIRNRSRGYSLFLPDSKAKCNDYWRLGYGIELINDALDTNNGCHLTEVTMELGDQRIVPFQLLVSSIAAIASRTRRLAPTTADAFVTSLRHLSILETVSDPALFQSQKTVTSHSRMNSFETSGEAPSPLNQISTPLTARLQSALQLRKNALPHSENQVGSTKPLSMQFKIPNLSSSVGTNNVLKPKTVAIDIEANNVPFVRFVAATAKRKNASANFHDKRDTGYKEVDAKQSRNAIPLELLPVASAKHIQADTSKKKKILMIGVEKVDKPLPLPVKTKISQGEYSRKKDNANLRRAVKSKPQQKVARVPANITIGSAVGLVGDGKAGGRNSF